MPLSGSTDTYENNIVPNKDLEITLKVIRTICNCCLGPNFFDADGAIVLSSAHAKIVELVKICEASLEPENNNGIQERN